MDTVCQLGHIQQLAMGWTGVKLCQVGLKQEGGFAEFYNRKSRSRPSPGLVDRGSTTTSWLQFCYFAIQRQHYATFLPLKPMNVAFY